jgi:kynurenine formamidase
MDLSAYRLVDLTHAHCAGHRRPPVHIERVPAPHAVPGDDQWYIMHRVEMALNHVGTHIEAPYHVRREGLDVAQLPLERLCGPAVALDLRGVPPGGVATLADVAAAAERAGGIRPGDMVFCRFDYDLAPEHDRQFSAEAIAYLVAAGMKLMGVDVLASSCPQTIHGRRRSTITTNCWIGISPW